MNKRLPGYMTVAAGFVPLACKMPYIFRAWRQSPLDRFDWIFGALFLAAAGIAWSRLRERREKPDGVALAALLPSLALFLLALRVDNHALGIIGAVAFNWSAVWLAWGWRSACCIFPAYGILMLMCTSSRYWLGYFFSIFRLDGLAIKAILTVLFAGWLGLSLLRERRVRRESFFFCLALLLVLMTVWQAGTLQRRSAAFVPEFHSVNFSGYLGRSLEPTADDRRFFGGSRLRKFFYAADSGIVNVLALTCGDDVHQIHPAGHCLRTSGWRIVSERLTEAEIGGRKLEVSEIVASNPGTTLLVWVWYSCRSFSTGSFLGFRRSWSADTQWHTYQISTPLFTSEEEGRARLGEFLNAAAQNRAN
ncbi:exosortase-associated EpsI family protein [Victivallis vadensis]|uniref:exosortase-associated EpsI family protein n=1 Tax=Victivallis vadensis TaxID=172901 RepID=UPI0023F4EA0C|nr:exosortase-associated EpsI family protein [Victivallis vadensis]